MGKNNSKMVLIMGTISGYIGFSIFPIIVVYQICKQILYESYTSLISLDWIYIIFLILSPFLGIILPWMISLIRDDRKLRKLAHKQVNIMILIAVSFFAIELLVSVLSVFNDIPSMIRSTSTKMIFSDLSAEEFFIHGSIIAAVASYSLGFYMQVQLIKKNIFP